MSARRIFVVRLGLIAAFGLVAAVDLASAQAITTGTIETVVVDTQDAVLPGATLTLRDVERGTTATLVSDGTGRAPFLRSLSAPTRSARSCNMQQQIAL